MPKYSTKKNLPVMDTSSVAQSETASRLISLGWQVLVKGLGYADATRFVMLLDKGGGDSVQYFRDLWKGQRVEDIYQEVIAARQRFTVPEYAAQPSIQMIPAQPALATLREGQAEYDSEPTGAKEIV